MKLLPRQRTAGVLAAVLLTTTVTIGGAVAQDLTHPQAMSLPAPSFVRPDPASLRVAMDQGLVAYVARDTRAPLASITAYIGVGTGHGAPGEAAALAAALRRGPAAMTSGEFAAALEQMTAEFRVVQTHEETHLSIDVPVEDAWAALNLMAKLIAAPRFAGEAAQAPTRSVAGGIDYAYSLASAITLFEQQLFNGHAFGRTASSAPRAAGVAKLHAAYVVPRNMTLAIAGDFDAGTADRELRKAFGGLDGLSAANQRPSTEVFPSLAARESRTLTLQNAHRDQGWVVIGQELPPVPLADEAALQVMDYILGAYHLDSRLYRNSRELRGLTNDNSSFLRPGINGPGAYSLRTYGRPEAVRLLIDVSFREIALMRDTQVTADELFVAKGALIDGLYATRYATGLDASRSYALEWLRQGNHDASASYPARVRAVTAKQVQDAARKYLHPERMIVTVVGPLDRINAAAAIEAEPALATWGEQPR